MELKNKIMQIYREHDNKYAKPLTRKKVRLLKFVLVDEEKDLNKISKMVPIGLETIERYIEEESLLEPFLTHEEFLEFKQKIEILTSTKNDKSLKYFSFNKREKKAEDDVKFLGYLIDDILNTRHTLDTLFIKNYVPNNFFSEVLKDDNYLDDIFGKGTKEKIQKKLQENKKIRLSCPKDEFVIEDRNQITVAKDEILYLNQANLKKLSLATSYLCCNADLEYISKLHEISIPTALTMLSDSRIKEIVKPVYYLKLKKWIDIENIFYGANILAKKKIIVEIVKFLENVDYNREFAMYYFDMPDSLFNKFLNEIVSVTYINDEIKKHIKDMMDLEKSGKTK